MTIIVFDIDGVVRDVSLSYRRAIADTVEHFTHYSYTPTMQDIDTLKAEGIWNNDWEASQELIKRYQESQNQTSNIEYQEIVAFFQKRYRGENWDGYITNEPLLMSKEYLQQLTTAGIRWGFFSGATRGSAEFILKQRLGLTDIVLVAMEDAPGKPDPTGLLAVVQLLQAEPQETVIYVGDTVGDMCTVAKAREIQPDRPWQAVGVLPPHVQNNPSEKKMYSLKLEKAGAILVLDNVQQLDITKVANYS